MIQCVEKHRRGYENLAFNDLIISDDTKELARRIFKKQQDIGHLSYLQGYIITDWVLLQNIYLKCNDEWDNKIDWMVKVIRAIWKYSTQMRKARWDKIHNANQDKQSISRKKTINLIQQELERTRYFGDFEIRQLQSNIKKSMANSPTTHS